MNKQAFLSFLLLIFSAAACAQEIILEGIYCGKNIYLQNPRSDTGFCMQQVFVNGIGMTFDSADAVQVKLDTLGLKDGDKIEVRIVHKNDCKPKVLNYNPCPPKYIQFVSISIDSTGTLKWKTVRETHSYPFIIERFQWNKWVKIGEVQGKGGADENEYSFVFKPHSGTNLVRVKQYNYQDVPNVSKSAEYISTAREVDVTSHRIYHEIVLTGETMYELYDQSGNVVSKGYGKKIDAKNIPRGIYYLNIDNKMIEVFKH